jgi:cell division protein FtsL
MLARKYDNYAWQEQEELQQPERRQRHKPDMRRVLRNRIFLVALTVLAAYLVTVVRSEYMVQYGSQLVGLQKQEAQLINQNNELRIEVEQLKGPERIIGLAEQRLGMSVARSNIYLKAAQNQKDGNSLAVNNK